MHNLQKFFVSQIDFKTQSEANNMLFFAGRNRINIATLNFV